MHIHFYFWHGLHGFHGNIACKHIQKTVLIRVIVPNLYYDTRPFF